MAHKKRNHSKRHTPKPALNKGSAVSILPSHGRGGPSKRPKTEDSTSIEPSSFWRDVSNKYFRYVDGEELQPVKDSIRVEAASASVRRPLADQQLMEPMPQSQAMQASISLVEVVHPANKVSCNNHIPNIKIERSKRGINTHHSRYSQTVSIAGSSKDERLNYGALFSFFDYYQDFINELGRFANPSGKPTKL